MADIKELGDALVNLTVKEVSELAGYLKEEHGIEPASAAVAVAGPAAGGLRRRDAGAARGRAAGAMGRGGDRRLCRLFLGRRAAESRQRDLRLDLRQSRLRCRGGRLWAQRSCRLFDGRLRAQLCAPQLRPVRR